MNICYKQEKRTVVTILTIFSFKCNKFFIIPSGIVTFFNTIKEIFQVQMLNNFLLIWSVLIHVANHVASSFRNSWNKRKFLLKKKLQLSQNQFGIPTWPPFYHRAFSLTWPESMQIYWNKRKRLHKKRVQ